MDKVHLQRLAAFCTCVASYGEPFLNRLRAKVGIAVDNHPDISTVSAEFVGKNAAPVQWKFGFAFSLMRLAPFVTSLSTARAGPGAHVIGFGALLCVIAVGGCAKQPSGAKSNSKEYFPSSVYGAASPRVVEDGAPVPRGGGRYLVGRPYTIAGRTYVPREVDTRTAQAGKASWYGSAFHGRRTANGEVYDMRSVTAAHPTWPLPSYARVTNARNGRSIIVRINDRGPFHAGRVMDVSSRVADALDFKRFGTADVKIEYVGKAGLAGSDDQSLMASLRTDGRPAQMGVPGSPQTMIAEAPAAKADPVEETTVVASTSRQPGLVGLLASSSAAPVQVAQVQGSDVSSFAAPAIPLPMFAPLPPVRPPSLGLSPSASQRPRSMLNFAPVQREPVPFDMLKLNRP